MRKNKSILVAADLTEASGEVLRAAGEIAAVAQAKLHVLHAFDLPTGASAAAGVTPATFTDRVAEAEAELDRQIGRAIPPEVQIASRRVKIHVAHKAIVDAAADISADLIVVGAHSHRRLGDELLGSTADRVIRSAEAPCLVVRRGFSIPLRRVLAPVDRSPAAGAALEVAMEWCAALGGGAGAQDAALTVLHVLPEALQIPEFSVDPEVIRGELHGEVEAARQRALGSRDLRMREEVRWGDSTLDEIVRFAVEDGTDLVVSGTHGHGAMKRFLIGSVASGLARRAPCSVLLVPPAMWEES